MTFAFFKKYIQKRKKEKEKNDDLRKCELVLVNCFETKSLRISINMFKLLSCIDERDEDTIDKRLQLYW